MSVIHYDDTYLRGAAFEHEAAPKFIPDGLIGGSLKVPTGFTVQFFQREDKSGEFSRVLYEGTYEDLSMYINVIGAKLMVVEETGLQSNEFVTGIDYVDVGTGTPYPVKFQIPPGKWDSWESYLFDNDALDVVIVPEGVCCKLYDDSQSNNYIELEGPGHFDLKAMHYENKVSRIDVEVDGWTVIEDLVDWTNEKIVATQRVAGGSATIDNRKGAADLTQKKSLRMMTQDQYERTWEFGFKESLSLTLKEEGGIPLVGKIEAEETASFEATQTFGGRDMTTVENELSAETEIVTPPGVLQKAILMYDRVTAEYPTYRIVRNDRTGEEIRQDTKVVAVQGMNETIVAEAME